jgi:hypothetical protein
LLAKSDIAPAIDLLKDSAISDNVVLILRNGYLSDSPYYYIDMEICHATLEQYIAGTEPSPYELLENERLFGVPTGQRGVWNTWDIMEQISSGMECIHKSGLLHCNLSPRNGTSLPIFVD